MDLFNIIIITKIQCLYNKFGVEKYLYSSAFYLLKIGISYRHERHIQQTIIFGIRSNAGG